MHRLRASRVALFRLRAVATLLLAWPLASSGQGAGVVGDTTSALVVGRVVNDQNDQPLAGVEVRLRGVDRMVLTDSLGAFRIASPLGRQVIVLTKVGQQPFSTQVIATRGTPMEYVLGLLPATPTLAPVTVAATMSDRRLQSFDAHRATGLGGHFFTTEQFTQEIGRSVADVLATTAGADIVRGRGGAAFYATRRGYDTIRGTLKISPADRARGASANTCYAAVIVNGIFAYRGDGGELLYDLNQLAPADLLGVEIYNGGATMPLEYNSMRTTCGLVVIWTR